MRVRDDMTAWMRAICKRRVCSVSLPAVLGTTLDGVPLDIELWSIPGW